MLGTPIWPNMRVPGPRLKNPSAIPASPGISFKFECGYVGALCVGWFKDPGMNCFLKIPFSKWSFFFF